MNEGTTVYDGRDLGCTYAKTESIFKLWAPDAAKVTLALYQDAGNYNAAGEVTVHTDGLEIGMKSLNNGIWFLRFYGDLAGRYYMYKIEGDDGSIRYVADPYSRAVSANGARSAIINMQNWNPSGWEEDQRPPMRGAQDAVLYELHVRDFSSDPDAGFQYKGKFKAFTETGLRDRDGNAIGIDHLAELGVTHVHLLPVFDFQTVNELQNDDSGASEPEYNWGYDPQHLNVPEGSYATDPTVPGVRILEFKEMVMALHRKGIRLIMDVVYNHTYSVEHGPFEAAAPGYFYRRDAEGRLTNGSGVGNELATERPMVRKYILDSVRYWAEEYHVDGFRFDLMGLIDTGTIEQVTEMLHREVDPSLLIYGEPWTGGETPLQQQTLKGTQRGRGFAVFNDHFRGALKGDSDGGGKGFATGQQGLESAVLEGVKGAVHDFTDSPLETINYVTVHDNLNLWDKVLLTQGLRDDAGFREIRDGRLTDGGSLREAVEQSDPYRSVDHDHIMGSETVKRAVLANGIVLTSQGIPMIQAGEELLRTKYGDHNSYRSGDLINTIRWQNKRRFKPVFDYYRGLITLRKNHPAFRMTSREQVEKHLEVLRCRDNTVAYRLKDFANGDTWKNIIVIYNANQDQVRLDIPFSITGWKVAVNAEHAGDQALELLVDEAVTVPALSMMVLYEEIGGTPRPTKRVDFQYERPDGKYEGWNLWVWGTGLGEQRLDFVQVEHGRAVATMIVPAYTKRIGYIVRLNEWEAKDVDEDRYIDLSHIQGTTTVLIQSGSELVKRIS
ncbi:type I pullulanase [Paenibacillus chibensis]|uniref:type I pullulanase n=1 Tax=Paenibacillus chibensis TaxID=59846 RepID=UPI000FD6FBBD|nr:type I pullulanase [Paenibacillus chibensis]MEC0369747.1 type I pullulanase [Paenibacillus chibensis]